MMGEQAATSPLPDRSVPEQIVFPEGLPVCDAREEILRAIESHQVIIVAGETGSGKTTQLPKLCLELGRGRQKRIGHTQPRRLAARTVAQRIADELESPLGDLVGYQIRFTDTVSEKSAIKLMTDGILLAELGRDADLNDYDTLIVDEAHERSLNIDFILGYLRQLLPRRPDLKVIITSATIDVDRFSSHFGDAPVISVSGKTHPVEIHHLDALDEEVGDVSDQVVSLVDDIAQEQFGPRGDVLVFLPGEREIRELARLLKGNDRIQVLPLYARLSRSEQNKVFNPKGAGMRVVLATNVAETSLTVPGIRYVIDPGTARISRYSHGSRLQRLPIEKISQASASQRAGRCGRVGPGVCIRLYSETDFLNRPEFMDPEILRTNLAAVILRMLQLRLGKVSDFPFIDPPEPKMIRDGYRLLEELGAVSRRGQLTATGRQMARLPIDPKLGRILIAAHESKCLAEVMIIVSAMSVQDPRERPAEKTAKADQCHARFTHKQSDFLPWLSLWQYYEEQRQALSQNQLRKLCSREFLSFMRMREWRDIHSQITIACRQMGLKAPALDDAEPDYRSIHVALLAGLLANVAQQDEGRKFNGTRNRKMTVFPGSGQYKKPPKWLLAGEIVETTQVYARTCAAIEPDWLLKVNPYLLKRHHYEPSWQMRSGRVMATERVTLYGLTISDGQRVHYGGIAPRESREMMIREALIPGAFKSPPGFLKFNLKRIREVEDLESRARRRDLLVDEESLFNFYDERLPADCVSAAALKKWLSRDTDADKRLRLDREQVLTRDPGAEIESQFPAQLRWADVDYRLSYQFEPGGETDGVTITIPLLLLNRAPRYRLDWLVPGLLRDKCIAMIKGLPKALRKQLVPVPDVVDQALLELEVDDVDLREALSGVLRRQRGVTIAVGEWPNEALEDFYRMNIRVVDERNRLLAQSRDMSALVAQFRDAAVAPTIRQSDSPERERVERWDFGDLPPQWKTRAAGMKVVAYPAIVADGGEVAVKLFDYPQDAQRAHRVGIAALAAKHQPKTVKYLRKQLFTTNEAALALAGCGVERSALVSGVTDAAFLRAAGVVDSPYSETEFKSLLEKAAGDWVAVAVDIERVLIQALQGFASARKAMSVGGKNNYADVQKDMERQVTALLDIDTIRHCPEFWLAQYPRYAKALAHRIERLSGQYPKDQRS
ncbi:ATP-dependent RNA helicase HrpA, partial [Luminiphilus syltensis]